jgi:protein PhnA
LSLAPNDLLIFVIIPAKSNFQIHPVCKSGYIWRKYSKKEKSMSQTPPCPSCQSEYAYSTGNEMLMCPECGHEWNPAEVVEEPAGLVVKDANGNILQDGDSVIVLKNLPVKGMPQDVKAGTKVKNIRLTEGDHNIDCKIDGFGSMGLKSEFVRKA